MKKIMILLGVLLFAGMSFAGFTFLDGGFWNDMQDMEKIMYVRGYNDGVMAGINATGEDFREVSLKCIPGSLTFVEFVAELEAFYKNPDNRNVRVANAIKQIVQEDGSKP